MLNKIRGIYMALDTSNKHTVLEEEASIYSSHRDTTEKSKWKAMNRKEKRVHFKEYYAAPLFAIIAVALIAAYLIYDTVSNYRNVVFMAAIINDQFDDDKLETFNSDILNYLGFDEKKDKVNIDDNYLLSGGSNADAANTAEQLTSYIYAKQLDVMISDKSTFNHYATLGCFSDLKEILTPEQYEKYKEFIYYPELEDTSANPAPQKENSARPKTTYACGIILSKSTRYMDLKGAQKEPVFGILTTSQRREDAIKVLEYLFPDASY